MHQSVAAWTPSRSSHQSTHGSLQWCSSQRRNERGGVPPSARNRRDGGVRREQEAEPVDLQLRPRRRVGLAVQCVARIPRPGRPRRARRCAHQSKNRSALSHLADLAHRVGDERAVAEPRVAVLLEVRACDVAAGRRLPGEDHLDGPPSDIHVYLTEPASRPCTKYRWNAKKTPSGTIIDRNDAGAMMSMFEPNWRSCAEDRDRDRRRVARHHERDEQVVPRPEELEDRERRNRRQAERQDQLQEDADLRRAVDARRLEDVLRYPDEEVSQQEDRERQPERRVEEDQAEDRVVEVRPCCRGGRSGSAPSAAARRAARSRRRTASRGRGSRSTRTRSRRARR